MQKYTLMILIFLLTACTLGQRRGQPTESAQSNVPILTSTPVEVEATSPSQTGPRRPRGIYAELHVELELAQQEKTKPSITPSELHAYFKNLYDGILANPAASGLAIGITWSILNPNPPSSPQAYDWSFMDDAFNSVAAWNAANPTKTPKTIQVQISAGFGTPKWVMDQIPSCDGLFQSPPQMPPGNCGKATFLGFTEGGGGVLPMPWNAFYKKSFKTFLTAFADRYESNPTFVSMDISGPTAASTEMILPNEHNTPNQFGGIAPDEMWLRLLALAYPDKPAYQNSDQAFIDEWDAAIDMFGETFSGITLVATTGDGLPKFSDSGFTVPAAFKDDCPTPDMDCAAETTILSHFVDSTIGGSNAKATQSSGMRGLVLKGPINIGVDAAKRLSQSTAQLVSPSAQILGGQQFATSATRFSVQEGCNSKFPPDKNKIAGNPNPGTLPITDIPQACLAPGVTSASLATYRQFSNVPANDLISPEQALYNVLSNYFDETPAATAFGRTPGTAPMNYLQIYVPDFQYATANANAPVKVIKSDGTSEMVTAQDLLNLASQKLLEISEPKQTP